MFPRYAGLLLLSLSLGQAEEPVAIVEQPITDADREHWAWRPLGITFFDTKVCPLAR